ncbi:MAG: MBL fold metallo-hydrolase [Fibrobacter sp.]|jgi:competence protein ComEC|nr:MBL fold metallo-hydrolase [Fibrobacter sp.]
MRLAATLIDVGWGDSILLESEDENGELHLGLIDSNDTVYLRSTYIFLKRYFDRISEKISGKSRLFDFVILSHAHLDHGQGLKAIMKEFGTENFWYPKSNESVMLSELLRYASRSSNVTFHQDIDIEDPLPDFGNATMKLLWPPKSPIEKDPNNTSIVLAITLNQNTFVLTGDAEKEVWKKIRTDIPADTCFFKVPHHGSANGTFDGNKPAWIDYCKNASLGISSHIRPYKHPAPEVIEFLKERNATFFRTDEHYHLTFETEGIKGDLKVKYSHY